MSGRRGCGNLDHPASCQHLITGVIPDDDLKFYEVRTEGGTFWIRAPRGSDASRLARSIMTADPDAVHVFMTTDLGFIDMADEATLAAAPKTTLQRERPVTSHADAESRMRLWAFDGHRGHDFAEPGERFCRVCGLPEDGIQHRPDYPREAVR